ncbi:hypothetical protein [Paenibacillus sp. OK076]|uniref:hypothetical protein n=1 Tax=Paenibacillus sp. OK076 TaxID=1884379 RepID=UPI0008D43659|nr:hypothetical protein [Paenibacillus sp. OK076]SEP33251.1 hypothetical protein SAMN05518670_6585 [Paenibacillus sp. OK076]
MFKAYRFLEPGGSYFPADPLETAADVYEYVKAHKAQYLEIRVTADNDNYIAVQAIDGVIVFPKQWALMEIKEKYIDEPNIFSAEAFKQALERSGFTVEENSGCTSAMALNYLTELYEIIEGED